MTKSNRALRQAVRLALATAAGATAAPLAFAQTAPESAAPVQEVVVTGSRLMQAPNEVSISPITSVSQEDIKATGLVRTEDVLQNLPQVAVEQTSGNSISSVGVATVSLRGLGSQRTLALVNGKRLNPGGAGGVPGGNASAADINQIPADLIERVDVLTGGASAVYGADAVAGVVNFVMNTHYEGVEVNVGYSFNNHKNDDQTYLGYLEQSNNAIPPSTVNTGQNRTASVIMGANFADGKGNATAYVTYLNSSPAVGNQFDHAGCTLNGSSSSLSAPPFCGGSSTSAGGRFKLFGLAGSGSTAHLVTLLNNTVDRTTGDFRNYNFGTDPYNYGALSYFQRKAERWTAGAFLHYDVNDHVQAYSETMYARNTNQAQYGPSGAFAYTPIPTSCDNPLLTAQEVATICTPANLAANQAAFGGTGNQFTEYVGRRNVEGGGRQDNYTSNSIRQVLGLKGNINDAWAYDVYGQFGNTDFSDFEGNFLGTQQIAYALDVIANPAVGGIPGVAPGTPVCRSALPGGNQPTCVPWNIWQKDGVTQAALNYLTVPASYYSQAKEYIADASVTGDLGKYGVQSPAAKSGLNVNVGAEWRQETFAFKPDYIFENGYQAGGAPAGPINGGFHVWEGFVEGRMPLIEDKPGAYLLSLEGGYRYSSYSEGFNTNTYKLGLEYAPIRSLRLRGGYNRAVRAPNIGELYEPPAVGAGGTADPCWGSTPVYTLAQCERTGVTPQEYGNIDVNGAAQINTQVRGVSTLKPETADTYTLGGVWQPEFVNGLSVSVDWFDIKIKDTITSLSSNSMIANCALNNDPTSCSYIHRGAGGSLWFNTAEFVDVPYQNIGTVETSGVDLVGDYHFTMGGAGKLALNLTGTYTDKFTVNPIPGVNYDCAGYWGSTCGAPLPKWRHVLNATWGTPWAGLDLTLRWRYIGTSSTDRSSSNPSLASPYYPYTAHIPAYNYIDLSAAMPLGHNFTARVGINNIADKNPPLILNGTYSDCPNTSCNDNTWVGTYDSLGRYIYANLTAKF
ncbi:MAG: TonB-dependent receptor [Proteobacteria bacterium]|nr:TonB-dependent receptor [Pseudomonadota bacterium]